MAEKLNITSRVGRVVDGSLYTPQDKDADGKPLTTKSGPNAGQPRVNFYFAVAIPKQPGETHFAQTPEGQQIWGVGHRAFPQAAQSPQFAWKVEDGDSQIPNMKGRKPCDREGYPGNWIFKFSGGFAPKIYQMDQGGKFTQVVTPDFVKPGYFVEVAFSVEGNNSQSKPGVYLNHSMVCFRAYGQEIVFGPDVAAAGFGGAPLPAGASATPPPSAVSMPAAPPVAGAAMVPGAAGSIPVIPGVPAPLVPGGSAPTPSAPVPGVAAPIPVIPNPQFLQVPPPAAPVAPVRHMTAAANGIPYEQWIAQNWTDALLVQNGYMLA